MIRKTARHVRLQSSFHPRSGSFCAPLAALVLLGASVLPGHGAYATTITATVAEDNGATTNSGDPGNTTPDANQDVYDNPTNHPGILTATAAGAASNGYSFGTSYTSLTSINTMSITLTMLNGSSATAAQESAAQNMISTAEDADYDHLVLYFGGTFSVAAGLTGGTEVIQADGTPLYLNGFLTNDAQSTVSFNNIQLSPATGSAIASLLSNGAGYLQAYIGTDNSNDSSIAEQTAGTGTGPAEIFLGNTGNPATANATTTLSFADVPEPGALTFLLAAGALLLPVYRARSRRSAAASADVAKAQALNVPFSKVSSG